MGKRKTENFIVGKRKAHHALEEEEYAIVSNDRRIKSLAIKQIRKQMSRLSQLKTIDLSLVFCIMDKSQKKQLVKFCGKGELLDKLILGEPLLDKKELRKSKELDEVSVPNKSLCSNKVLPAKTPKIPGSQKLQRTIAEKDSGLLKSTSIQRRQQYDKKDQKVSIGINTSPIQLRKGMTKEQLNRGINTSPVQLRKRVTSGQLDRGINTSPIKLRKRVTKEQLDRDISTSPVQFRNRMTRGQLDRGINTSPIQLRKRVTREQLDRGSNNRTKKIARRKQRSPSSSESSESDEEKEILGSTSDEEGLLLDAATLNALDMELSSFPADITDFTSENEEENECLVDDQNLPRNESKEDEIQGDVPCSSIKKEVDD